MLIVTRDQGYWRERFVVLHMLVLTVTAISMVVWLLWPSPQPRVSVANLAELRPDTVRPITLPAPFRDPLPPVAALWGHSEEAPVPVMLRYDPQAGILAFFNRDPHSGCQFAWVKAELKFIDPCHGSVYTPAGTYVRGPSARDLDQFGVSVTSAGAILVDVRDFRPGRPIR